MLRGRKKTEIYIIEDFTQRVRELWRYLNPFVTKLRDDGRRASLVHDLIMVNEQRYDSDPVSEKPKQTQYSYSPRPLPLPVLRRAAKLLMNVETVAGPPFVNT